MGDNSRFELQQEAEQLGMESDLRYSHAGLMGGQGQQNILLHDHSQQFHLTATIQKSNALCPTGNEHKTI